MTSMLSNPLINSQESYLTYHFLTLETSFSFGFNWLHSLSILLKSPIFPVRKFIRQKIGCRKNICSHSCSGHSFLVSLPCFWFSFLNIPVPSIWVSDIFSSFIYVLSLMKIKDIETLSFVPSSNMLIPYCPHFLTELYSQFAISGQLTSHNLQL